MNPIGTASVDAPAHVCSFLHAGPELTLKEFDAIRNEIGSRLESRGRRVSVAVDISPDMESTYRLTILCGESNDPNR